MLHNAEIIGGYLRITCGVFAFAKIPGCIHRITCGDWPCRDLTVADQIDDGLLLTPDFLQILSLASAPNLNRFKNLQ